MASKYFALVAIVTLIGCLTGCAAAKKCQTDQSGHYSCSYSCENFQDCDACGE